VTGSFQLVVVSLDVTAVVVLPCPTLWVTGSETLLAYSGTAGWAATMMWSPIANEGTVQVATPFVMVRDSHPAMGFSPAVKETTPNGVPVEGAVALTVAVRITDWLNMDGFGAATTTVDVSAWLLVWVMDDEVLAAKLPLPL
jgi:hypothetical protein